MKHTHTHTHTHFRVAIQKARKPPRKRRLAQLRRFKRATTSELIDELQKMKRRLARRSRDALQRTTTATRSSRRSRGAVLKPTRKWPAHDGKQKLRANQKTAKTTKRARTEGAKHLRKGLEKKRARESEPQKKLSESRPLPPANLER